MVIVSRYLRRIDTPIGRIEVTGDDAALHTLHIENDGRLPGDERPERSNPHVDAAARQLVEYFRGERTEFDLPVRLGGTGFQKAVWAELRRIRWGQTTTYGGLAAAVGRPGAARAIGGAVGANPLPVIVGCHRVLAGDRRITGYSGGSGIPTKQALLRLEKIAFVG